MEIKQQSPWSRTTITILAVVVLCGAGLAYSRGWFDSATISDEMEINQVGTQQSIERVEAQPENAKTMSENAAVAHPDTE